MANCVFCGARIVYRKRAGGWLHADPLHSLRVTHYEAQDVMADPPRKREPLHRQTVLHPAQPG